MATTVSIISTQFTDVGPSGQLSLAVHKRVVSTTALDVKTSADLKTIRDAACGEPLSRFLAAAWSSSDLLSAMRLRQYTVTPVAGGQGKIFDVQCIYNTEYVWANINGGGGSDQLMLPVQVEFEAGERIAQLYRNSPTTSPSANLNTAANIGGTSVDEQGKPVQIRIPTMDVKISLIVDVSNLALTSTLVTAYDKISTIAGTWNSTTFLHWSANEVFCTSANLTHVRDEFYRASFAFRWDKWYDCEQIVQCDNDGYPFLIAGKATTVYWKSLVRGTSNHNLLFDLAPNTTLATQVAKEGCYLTYP